MEPGVFAWFRGQRRPDLAPQGYPASAVSIFFLFTKTKTIRREALTTFFSNFGICVGSNEPDLMALSTWFASYAPALGEFLGTEEARDVFSEFSQPWIGNWHVLNLLFDLGTFIGDVIIVKKPNRRWERIVGRPDFAIIGQHSGRPVTPATVVFNYCARAYNEILMRGTYDKPHHENSESFFRQINALVIN